MPKRDGGEFWILVTDRIPLAMNTNLWFWFCLETMWGSWAVAMRTVLHHYSSLQLLGPGVAPPAPVGFSWSNNFCNRTEMTGLIISLWHCTSCLTLMGVDSGQLKVQPARAPLLPLEAAVALCSGQGRDGAPAGVGGPCQYSPRLPSYRIAS